MSLYDRIAEAEESLETANHFKDYSNGAGGRSGLSIYSKNPNDKLQLINMYRAMNADVEFEVDGNQGTVRMF